MKRHAHRIWLLLLAGMLLAGCHSGDNHGSGSACPCRAPLVCVAHTCELADGAADERTETSSDVAADAPDSGAPDTATDAADPDGGATDAIDDASDGAPKDAASPKGDPDQPPVLHVFATTENGGLWLVSATVSSIQGPVGNHAVPIDVMAHAGFIGPVDDVEAQSIGGEVNALARQGSDAFATRVVGQTWTPLVKVASDVRAMALANVNGNLWACLVGSTGRLRLMVRQNDKWQDVGDVTDEASLPSGMGEGPSSLDKLDCAGVGGDLEIVALDRSGALWHATRTPARWVQFRPVQDVTGFGLRDVDVVNSVGEIHVLGSSQSTQFHGAFDSNGIWSGFSDIEGVLRRPPEPQITPPGDIRAAAEASLLGEVEWLQATTVGEIWLGTRFRNFITGYGMYIGRAPDDSGFVSVSATSVTPD